MTKYNIGDVYKHDDKIFIILRTFPGMKSLLVAPVMKNNTKSKNKPHIHINLDGYVNFNAYIFIESIKFVDCSQLKVFIKKISDKELNELNKYRKLYGF